MKKSMKNSRITESKEWKPYCKNIMEKKVEFYKELYYEKNLYRRKNFEEKRFTFKNLKKKFIW